MKKVLTLIAIIGVLLGFAAVSSVRAAGPPPSYTLQFLGDGSVTAINNVNTVVGMRTNPTNSWFKIPLVSVGGGSWTLLPLPAGATGGFPTALNDSGTIVGVADMASGKRAIRWLPGTGGYAVELLPLLPGEGASYTTGTGLNNLGDIGWGELGAGHDNLVELALGTPPLQSNPSTVLTTLEKAGEARHLQLDVTKNPLVGNVIFRVEVAGSPAGPWSSDPLTAVEILHEDSSRLIARDRTPVGAAAQRFIRLRIGTAP